MEKGKITFNGSYSELESTSYFQQIKGALDSSHFDDSSSSTPEEVKEVELSVQKNYLSTQGTSILTKEDSEDVKVSFRSYIAYFFFDWKVFVTSLLAYGVLLGGISLRIFYDYYLLKWVQALAEDGESDPELFQRFLIFALTCGLAMMLGNALVFGYAFFVSSKLFEKINKRLFNAPINTYFDVTPQGVILNRLSKDINIVDNALPFSQRFFIFNALTVIVRILMSALSVIWILIAIPFLILASIYLLSYFVKALKESQRIESVTNSPVITHLGETIQGNSTIRAFREKRQFSNRMFELQERNIVASLLVKYVFNWFSLRLYFLSTSLMVIVFAILVSVRGTVDPVLSGMIMIYISQIQISLYFMFHNLAIVESQFVSFERCRMLNEIPQEAAQRLPCDPNWVSQGDVMFNEFKVRYREDTEEVLKGLNFKITGGEKIGVVGRTGAGKSTLCLCLCRIIEASAGQIVIDGTDISTLGLADLRDQITIIPQQPVLFKGTLRFNLDPDEKASDSEILSLMGRARLQKDLNFDVDDQGTNLSSGEKQLVCICRAVLRKTKIVLMDEATSNIDLSTEKAIQQLVDTEFRSATVITVAHRLNTVNNSDKVLVLGFGKVLEYDSPEVLKADPNSVFYSLLKEFKQTD